MGPQLPYGTVALIVVVMFIIYDTFIGFMRDSRERKAMAESRYGFAHAIYLLGGLTKVEFKIQRKIIGPCSMNITTAMETIYSSD